MAIQMRRGNEVDFDADKMLPGEWAVSLDTANNQRIIRMCFAPGICVRMATYEAFEADMAQIMAILAECQSIEAAVTRINTEVSVNAEAVAEYTELARQSAEDAQYWAEQAEAVTDVHIATSDRAGIIKSGDLTVDDDGGLRVLEQQTAPLVTITPSYEGVAEVSNLPHNILPNKNRESSRTKYGMEFTNNSDGTVSVTGTTTQRAYFQLANNIDLSTLGLKDGDYITLLINDVEHMTVNIYDGTTYYGSGGVATCIVDTSKTYMLQFSINPNVTYDNFVVKPMLAKGTESKPYVPYGSYEVKSENADGSLRDAYKVTPTTDKAYVNTYDGTTNIFTDYGIDLDVSYGKNETGAKIFEGVEANSAIHAQDFKKKVRVNKNLLDNPRFKVNQRGQSSYGEMYNYTVDRWVTEGNSNNFVMNVLSDGISITVSDYSQQYYGSLAQRFYPALKTSLLNKTLTFSVIVNNELYSTQFTLGNLGGGFKMDNLMLYSAGSYDILLRPNTTSTVTIKAVKLELGTEQTLAYKDSDGEWQLYDDYDYNVDLLECQRYFVRLHGTNYTHLLRSISSTVADVTFELPVEMTHTPTVTTASTRYTPFGYAGAIVLPQPSEVSTDGKYLVLRYIGDNLNFTDTINNLIIGTIDVSNEL